MRYWLVIFSSLQTFIKITNISREPKHVALVTGCCSILQTGHIILSSTLDQQLQNNSTKYHRQQPLYNTLELLMMGIVVPKTF